MVQGLWRGSASETRVWTRRQSPRISCRGPLGRLRLPDERRWLSRPRIERGGRHDLFDVVPVARCAVLPGGDPRVDGVELGRSKVTRSCTLTRPHRIPSHDRFGRVGGALDPAAFEAASSAGSGTSPPPSPGRWSASLGAHRVTTRRQTHDLANGNGPLHPMGAGTGANRLALAQAPVNGKIE